MVSEFEREKAWEGFQKEQPFIFPHSVSPFCALSGITQPTALNTGSQHRQPVPMSWPSVGMGAFYKPFELADKFERGNMQSFRQ